MKVATLYSKRNMILNVFHFDWLNIKANYMLIAVCFFISCLIKMKMALFFFLLIHSISAIFMVGNICYRGKVSAQKAFI